MSPRRFTARRTLALSLALLLLGALAALCVAGLSLAEFFTAPAAGHLALLVLILTSCLSVALGLWHAEAEAKHEETEENIYRSFVEASAEAMAILDGSGRILRVNSRLEALLGFTAAELVGKPADEFLHQDRRSRTA